MKRAENWKSSPLRYAAWGSSRRHLIGVEIQPGRHIIKSHRRPVALAYSPKEPSLTEYLFQEASKASVLFLDSVFFEYCSLWHAINKSASIIKQIGCVVHFKGNGSNI